MKYIIACLISFGVVSAGMTQGYPNEKTSAPGYYDKNSGNIPSVDPYSNDHLNPNKRMFNDNMDKVFVKGAVMPELKSESPAVDINEHLSMKAPDENQNNLNQALRQTEFGKACSMKRMESGEQSDMSFGKSFRMKDKNLKVERKVNGVERIRFHNKNEFLSYHHKKNGKSHYKYLYKEGNSLVRVEKNKNGQGFIILASGDLENYQPSLLMDTGVVVVEKDVSACMR